MTDTAATGAARADDRDDAVLVVGAGPVGLVTACELSRQGARVRLIDALPQPTDQSRAVVVHPRTQEHLAAMGVLDDLAARALPVTRLEVRTGRDGTPRVRLTTGSVDSRYPRILDVAQPETEAVLTALAARSGVVVERGVTLQELAQDDGGVTVTLAGPGGGSRHRYGWVVGADGGHSAVRAAVGTHLDGVFHGQHFLFADTEASTALSADAIRMFAHPEGIGGVFPMPGGRSRFLFQVDAPAPDAVPTVAETQRLVDERTGGRWTVRGANWLTYFEIHHGQVPAYRHGRVLLAGDAAHVHSPAGGQGMNTGVQDAVNLAWKLALVATGRADERLLDSYQAERHPVGAAVVRQTSTMTDVMASAGATARLRDIGLFVLGHLPALGEKLVAGVTEVTVHYRDSPIVTGSGGHRTAAPGDHAPDVPGLRTVDGAEAWIGDLLRRPGHLLLVARDDPRAVAALREALGGLGAVVPVVRTADGAPADALVDHGGAVARRYGLDGDGMALIRPDGYLGHLSTTADPRVLADHLTGALAARARVTAGG
ncbi:FAD-dependent monooxygenase [Geodermatophilus sp. SYSU D00815]